MSITSLLLAGRPKAMGSAHGGRYREQIARFAAERTAMAASAYWAGRELGCDAVLTVVERCLEPQRRFDADMADELDAMAAAAGLSAAELLLVSGFTDLVDTLYNAPEVRDARPAAPAPPAADQCTAWLVPGARSRDGHALFAQTWDMHESAAEHVLLIEGRPDDAPDFLAFTSRGCPGMIGMNSHGITVGINNLVAIDGQPGVTWNAVVRSVLRQTDIHDALACITEAPLAGAHNYLLLDGEGRGYNVEAMPSRCHVTPLADTPLVHTNHCLAAETRAVERQRLAASQAASERRLARAEALLGEREHHDMASLAAITRDPEAICVRPTAEVREASCGAVIADPAGRRFWALRGLPAENDYQAFSLTPA